MDLTTGYISTDVSLISRCKNGDNTAYKALYSLYVKAMLNISVRILNNKNEAEDVLQESFLKAFKNIKNFNNEAAFAGWLKRVVINSSIDLIRKRNSTPLISLGDNDYADTPEEEYERIVYDISRVRSCISQLPDGYRIVLTLFLIEKCSHKDIAALLHISEGTSKSQYNRAKKKLIQLIQQKQ